MMDALRHGVAAIAASLVGWLALLLGVAAGLAVLDALFDPLAVIAAVTYGVTVVAAVVGLGALVSALYIGAVYGQRYADSPFLTLLVRLCIRVSVAAAIVLVYIALALSGNSLGKPWGAIVIGLPVAAMMSVPISVARLWLAERRTN